MTAIGFALLCVAAFIARVTESSEKTDIAVGAVRLPGLVLFAAGITVFLWRHMP